MAWVKRVNGVITDVLFHGPDYTSGISTEVADDDPELIAFVNREPEPPVFPTPPDEGTEDETLEEYTRRRTRQLRGAGVSVNGVLIPTDDVSQRLITGLGILAQNSIAQNQGRTFPFDAGDQLLTLTDVQAFGLANAVADHTQDTFTKRIEILAAISEGTITTKEQIDAELG